MQILPAVEDSPGATNIRTQSIALWSGPVVGVVLLLAFIAFPGFWPPMSPTMTAEQVAAFYAEHTAWIRFSQTAFNLCGILLLPFFMVIVVQMKRMRTQSHVFAYCFLTAVVSGATIFALSNIFFLVAAFRPERNPELVQLVNDMAWIIFVAPVGMVVAQLLLLAAAVHFDEADDPVFPRWVAPFSVAVAAAMAPSVCAAVVKTGPLAWDGAVSFWLRAIAFGVFITVMFVVVRRTLHRQGVIEGLVAA
ncbi:hypothetical protein [Mycolicibacterium palauense]|uniref:hypothetical protein n=1 Tax=Mycolicibacterium palauense TaxID=2034511 RepID=UPI000BFEBEE9|nr:hypothetical protein [Mycolicibacterium palauense]